MTLEEFNLKYKYQLDKAKFGFVEVWDIPKLQDDGYYYGDCEDYCIFLKHKVDGFKDWSYIYCKLNEIGHCILMKDGLVIDCNSQKVMYLSQYITTYNVHSLKKYSWFVIASKFLAGSILKFLDRLCNFYKFNKGK